jgi:hypothetical protein
MTRSLSRTTRDQDDFLSASNTTRSRRIPAPKVAYLCKKHDYGEHLQKKHDSTNSCKASRTLRGLGDYLFNAAATTVALSQLQQYARPTMGSAAQSPSFTTNTPSCQRCKEKGRNHSNMPEHLKDCWWNKKDYYKKGSR